MISQQWISLVVIITWMIMVRLVTKQCLRRLLDGGDITGHGCKKFYSAVRAFYMDAASQALKNYLSQMMYSTMQDFWILRRKRSVLSIPYSSFVIDILAFLALIRFKWIIFRRSSLLISFWTNLTFLERFGKKQLCMMRETVVTPAVQNTYKRCRSRKCIRWHIPVHAIFAVFLSIFLTYSI